LILPRQGGGDVLLDAEGDVEHCVVIGIESSLKQQFGF
jgi:hypothetical protein